MSTTTTVTESPVITAETIRQLFPDIDSSSDALSGHDAEQIRLMDEVCIVTDNDDLPIGNLSKKICTLPPAGTPTRCSCRGLSGCLRCLLTGQLVRRPSHDQHRQGSPPPCLLRLPLQR